MSSQHANRIEKKDQHIIILLWYVDGINNDKCFNLFVLIFNTEFLLH